MIGRISGRLDWRGPDHVLIDVRGVGYIVHVSDRTLRAMPGVGEAVSLYTDLLVREDLLQLFGFPTMLEKEWHKLLMTVQGVGAKAAMAILGTLGAEGVGRAITLGDARAVQSAPGVGPKLAQRICAELKDKAPSFGHIDAGVAELAGALDDKRLPQPVADAVSALTNLGYPQAQAVAAVAAAARAAGEEAGTAQLIRLGLKELAK